MIDDDKRLAAEAAVAEIADGMLVGLGTGSTAAHAITALGRRVREGLRIEAVATSMASARAALALGITVHDFADVARVDLTIDGADEIDDRLFAIKGAGGAMLREKVVATASGRMVAIADGTKRVALIGRARVPVEVLPFARAFADRELADLGAIATWRVEGDQDYRTDQGNPVADCAFATLDDPVALATALQAIPGVLAHGLFLTEIDAAYVAHDGVVAYLDRTSL